MRTVRRPAIGAGDGADERADRLHRDFAIGKRHRTVGEGASPTTRRSSTSYSCAFSTDRRGRRRSKQSPPPATNWRANIKDLVAELDEYRKTIGPVIAKREAKREEQIKAATAELERYKQEIAPAEAEKEKQYRQQIAKLQAELDTYDQKQLQAALDKWEADYKRSVTWVPLDPQTVASSGGLKIEKLPDLSIRASGVSSSRIVHTVTAVTNLKRITGIKLEALTDGSYKGLGPGLGDNPNFVLTELTTLYSDVQKRSEGHKDRLRRRESDALADQLRRQNRRRREARSGQQRLGDWSANRQGSDCTVRAEAAVSPRSRNPADVLLRSAVCGQQTRPRPLPAVGDGRGGPAAIRYSP